MRKMWSLKTLSILLLLGIFNISPASGAKPWPTIALNPVVTGLNFPMFITHAGDNSGRLFILERAGTVRIFKDGVLQDSANPFLDITDRVGTNVDGYNDGALQCIAFPAGFKKKQYFYVYYTDTDGNPVLSRFKVSSGNPDVADANSEEKLLQFTSSEAGSHQGGWIGFHPRNRYLYISTGDTGPQEDPFNNAQNPAVLRGKILRIDVEHGPDPETGQPYRIPRKNPFVNNPDYLPEIWSLGLRNPFRCSFDGGQFYIGDVGYNTAEEINFELPSSKGGNNYGWNILEGTDFTGFNGNTLPPNYQAPVAVFDLPPFNAIIGGYVYRGPKFRLMRGTYFFANFGNGQIWGMRKSENWATTLLLEPGFAINSFGVDQKRNLYVAGFFNGTIYQIVETEIVDPDS
jgi:glucose/arabinose dehydrogenase